MGGAALLQHKLQAPWTDHNELLAGRESLQEAACPLTNARTNTRPLVGVATDLLEVTPAAVSTGTLATAAHVVLSAAASPASLVDVLTRGTRAATRSRSVRKLLRLQRATVSLGK